MQIIYSPRYNFQIPFLDKVYWFDGRKFARVRGAVEKVQSTTKTVVRTPTSMASTEDCLTVHDQAYLDTLRLSKTVAEILEFAPVRFLPNPVAERLIVEPQLWMAAGTMLAGHLAWTHKMDIYNIGGGFHHAYPDHGEGFCLVNDVAMMVAALRAKGMGGKVAYIDVDAHMGNGVAHCLASDRGVVMVDLYNRNIYPQNPRALDRIDIPVKLSIGVGDYEYLAKLERALSQASERGPYDLCIVVAGTDVYQKDPIGKMGITEDGIRRRDRLVFEWCRSTGAPFVALTGGGYTKDSARLVSTSVIDAATRWGRDSGGPEGPPEPSNLFEEDAAEDGPVSGG